MTEIEIYTKIMEIVDAEDAQAASTALEFISRKIQNKIYANQQLQGARQIGCNTIGGDQYVDYQAKQNERAIEEVRKIVRQEMLKESTAPMAENEEKAA